MSAVQFEIELTLTRRKPVRKGFDWSRWRINEHNLTDAAFRPKTYTVTLERGGTFLTPWDVDRDKGIPFMPRFASRLSFEPSPNPPREEWKEPVGAPDANEFWEWKQFCSQKLSREE